MLTTTEGEQERTRCENPVAFLYPGSSLADACSKAPSLFSFCLLCRSPGSPPVCCSARPPMPSGTSLSSSSASCSRLNAQNSAECCYFWWLPVAAREVPALLLRWVLGVLSTHPSGLLQLTARQSGSSHPTDPGERATHYFFQGPCRFTHLKAATQAEMAETFQEL